MNSGNGRVWGTRGCLALAVTVMLAAGGAAAQSDAPNTETNTVTVTGNRLPADKLERVADAFVRTSGESSPSIDQLTRWREAICPEAMNVTPEVAGFVTKRIRAVAQAAHAPTAEDGCKPNVQIIFTDNPQALVDKIAQKDPVLLGHHYAAQTQAVSTVNFPIQAWYVTATSSGLVTRVDATERLPNRADASPSTDEPGALHGMLGSRLGVKLESVFDHVLIVVNTDRIVGEKFGTVADYLAMLALTRPALTDQCAPLSSILDLFKENCATTDKARALSPADKAYLEGLYTMDPRALGTFQRSSIVGHIVDSLGAP
ncbi:MAG: hypothetical protein PW843_16565 [Azospirillaceae bacterium]|nr:hypothetical protein [Azospirillaceae bacterium]